MINFKEEFSNCLVKALNKDKFLILENIETPPDFSLGNFSFPCFVLSKELKMSPIVLAKETLKKLSSDLFVFSEINGYINATVIPEILYKETIKEILDKKENYGKVKKTNKEYLIDTFNVNTFKTLHIGHLRMIVGGDSIHRLLEVNGDTPLSIYYGGDVGTHVSKWYWYYSKYLTEKEKEIPKKDIAKWFGLIYLEAGKKEKENPEYTKEIDAIQKQMLTDPVLQKEIIRLRDKSFDAYMDVKKELEINLSNKIFESEAEKRFLKIKDCLFSKHKELFKESNNSTIADLKSKNLEVLVLIKHNGAPLYAAKDIALVELKKEKYPSANDFLYVVGNEQSFYLKQMFEIFSILYPNTTHKHLSLGMVNLSSGKMASREGEMVLYEDFRDKLKEKVLSVLKENNLMDNKEIVSSIVSGTIKFEMLKISFNKTFIFDIDAALNLQGDSCVYIQYSGVRAKSILRKIKETPIFPKTLTLEPDEKKLLTLLSQFPEKIKLAKEEYKPNIIANYTLELSRTFNRFYTNCPVISSNSNLQNQRVFLIKAYLQCLENALWVLGIKIPERM